MVRDGVLALLSRNYCCDAFEQRAHRVVAASEGRVSGQQLIDQAAESPVVDHLGVDFFFDDFRCDVLRSTAEAACLADAI